MRQRFIIFHFNYFLNGAIFFYIREKYYFFNVLNIFPILDTVCIMNRKLKSIDDLNPNDSDLYTNTKALTESEFI